MMKFNLSLADVMLYQGFSAPSSELLAAFFG
jgi:hypothetical protein